MNQQYLNKGKLKCYCLSRGDIWIDVGVLDGFSDAFHLIKLAETRMGLKIGCPEEASYIMGNISEKQLLNLVDKYTTSTYGNYLKKILETDYT